MKTENVILVIADLSGYTRFMVEHKKAVVHGQMIINELLQLLVHLAEPPLHVVELEGDAVFMYAVKPKIAASEANIKKTIGGQLLNFCEAFKKKANELQAYSMCHCDACLNISNMKLKIIVHAGEAVFSKIGNFSRLSGVDVITVHRLLKNSVKADEYILATESAIPDIQFPVQLETIHVEETYDVGTIKTQVSFPKPESLESAQNGVEQKASPSSIGLEILRYEIQREYTEVACTPNKGFHFHTGRTLAKMLDYDAQWYTSISAEAVESFAGTGNPFSVGKIQRGDYVVDVGSGAGFDALIAAHLVGPSGRVVGVDMTPAMINKANAAAEGLNHVEFREGFAEFLPLPDEWADVVISNGVFNLCPNKPAVLQEMYRVLKPGGRLQLADLVVQRAIPEKAKKNIDLWTG